jgi:hypothetical protein
VRPKNQGIYSSSNEWLERHTQLTAAEKPRPLPGGGQLLVATDSSAPLGSDYILSDLRPMIFFARQLPRRV